MASPAWTYSDWITYATGTASRLSQLRLHIKEVSDAIKGGNFSIEGRSHDRSILESYLRELHAKEKQEANTSGATAGNRSYFTRARTI